MAKKLVGIDSLDEAICQADGKIYVDHTVILTPGAKDELIRRGIPIVYGTKPEAEQCAHAPAAGASTQVLENILQAVTKILGEQYHITDPGQLKAISCQVIKTIKENL
jgi:hypothetical protein